MNTQLINQIKALEGVKEVTLVNDMAMVVFEPMKPEPSQKLKLIYTDPEDGTEFFDGDFYLYFDKYTCEVVDGIISNLTFKQEDETSSKIYKSRQLCELALAKFIMDKYK